MPEEINRIVADEFSEHLFLHSDEAIANLRAEGIAEERMHFVGNTMIDTLVALEERFRARRGRGEARRGARRLRPRHPPSPRSRRRRRSCRRRCAGSPRSRADAGGLPGPPAHPQDDGGDSAPTHPACCCSSPLGYIEFLSLLADAGAVLTDSGGIQEETTFLGIPCFTLRDNTERPITISAGTNTLLGLDPAAIAGIPDALEERGTKQPGPPPLWDGRASERIADVLTAG